MLVEFRLKNFRSYRDEYNFSMVASSDKELVNNTTATAALGKIRLNHSAVIYGPNAAGKSNLIEAVDFVSGFVRTFAERIPSRLIPVKPFLFDEETRDAPSEFEITFLLDGVRYEYGFIVDQEHVHEEWLIAYPKGSAQIWFERSKNADRSDDEWYFGRHLKGEKGRLIPLTRPNVLFLSLAAQFNHEQLKPIYHWLATQLFILKAGESLGILEYVALNYIDDRPELQERVNSLLRFADLGITHFAINEPKQTNGNGSSSIASEILDIPKKPPEEMTHLIEVIANLSERNQMAQKSIEMYHRVNGTGHYDIPINISEESFGTRRLFALASVLLHRLEVGGILLIDELDSSLHSLLAREIVRKFHNPNTNPGNAQLIFNTHDVTLLDQTLFRRDQIWFAEKGRDGASKLYSLLDYKPRKLEALSRGYLQGRYGAVPFLDTEPLDLQTLDREAAF